ncbi:MAG: hypothetical protein EXQ56_00110 [Acidobacteria bacterium]|nr:hypothetical protein [Acidobacteriota bacterium]
MSNQGQQLLQQVLSLPPEESAQVAEKILSSLDASAQQEIDSLWAAEAESRIDAFERGEMQSIPAEDVFRSIRK